MSEKLKRCNLCGDGFVTDEAEVNDGLCHDCSILGAIEKTTRTPATTEVEKCPACGRPWDMTKHNACECGASFTAVLKASPAKEEKINYTENPTPNGIGIICLNQTLADCRETNKRLIAKLKQKQNALDHVCASYICIECPLHVDHVCLADLPEGKA